jgi:hypothetical protein
MIANITSGMMKENDRTRWEYSTQLQTKIQSVTKEDEVVRKSTSMELINFVQNFENVCVCNGMNVSRNAYISQTNASVNNLRLEMNQNKEVKNKVGELTLEIRSVASNLDECNSNTQSDK